MYHVQSYTVLYQFWWEWASGAIYHDDVDVLLSHCLVTCNMNMKYSALYFKSKWNY